MRAFIGIVVLALIVTPVWSADDGAIKIAIERGVTFLKASQAQNGQWNYADPANGGVGATALAGLTLLECGVKPDEVSVQKAAAFVREASINLTHTYSLSLGIMFLDRLGEPADVPVIESMAIRLMAGQTAQGGWFYNCPSLAQNEAARIQNLVRNRNQLVAGRDVPKPGQRRELKDLPKEIQAQVEQIRLNQFQPAADAVAGVMGDNSNTQFATLGLWVARRHGIPVDKALGQVEQRFRGSQNADGGWSYSSVANQPGFRGIGPMAAMGGGMSSPAMTAAGLLGLAAAYGSFNEAAAKANENKTDPKKPDAKMLDPNKDPAIRAGLIALGSAIGNPIANQNVPAPQFNPMGFNRFPPQAMNVPVLGPDQNGQGYYFLWSLERVAVAYGLETVGNKDWYGWGSQILLNNQQQDGSWRGQYAEGGVDTCFALLFLRRANLAKDLTATLKGKIADPDNRELKAGGVGGGDLKKGLGLKPAFDTSGDKKPATGTTETPDKPVLDGEAGKLAEELVSAVGRKQDELLDKLRDSKGSVFTQALTGAIPRLTGPVKTRARDALAERLTRMTGTTLKDKLQDDDLEVRRAAALAVAMKEEMSFFPRLIEMLNDPEPPVARAAQAALKSLSSQDFGPEADASRADRDKAIAAWKAWWAKQGNK